MFTVTTESGMKMILANAGKDADGNQLWRQVPLSARERERNEAAK